MNIDTAQYSSAQRKVWFNGYGIFGIEGWPNQVGVQVELTWWVLGSNFSLKGLSRSI
jgi:hypothetical protein